MSGRVIPRLALTVTGLFGLLALFAAGLLSPWFAAVGWILLATAHLASAVWTSELTARARRIAGVFVLVSGAAVALVQVGDQGTVPGLPLLSVVLVAVTVAHALALESRRDSLVSLGLAVMMLVMAAGVATTADLVVPLVGGWGAAMATLAVIFYLPDPSTPYSSISTGGRRVHIPALRQVGTTMAVALVCGLIVFLLMPDVNISPQSGFSDAIAGRSEGIDEPTVRDVVGYTGGAMDLRSRGDLSTESVLEVPAKSPEYWRASTLDVYAGGMWDDTSPQVAQLDPGQVFFPAPAAAGSDSGAWRSYQVKTLKAYPGALIAPGDIVGVDSQMPIGVRASGTGFSLSEQSDYVVTSSPIPMTSLARPTSDGPPSPPDRVDFTALPDELPARVTELGRQLVTGANTRAEAVSNIESYLRADAEYLLDAPVPPSGQDPVDFFLFDSHLGYCEQFASAEVVLLRAGGIPARMATGFINGIETAGGGRQFRGVDAHAWAEVWVQGVGWTTTDPTSGVTQAGGKAGVSHAVEQWITQLLGDMQGRVVTGLLLMLFLVAAALAMRWVSAVRMRRRDHKDQSWSEVEPAEPLAAFGRLERVLVRRGQPRQPSETVAELGDRLPDGSSAALATVERACYAGTSPSDSERIVAGQELDEVIRRLTP